LQIKIYSQNFIASIYTYLVERMHFAINKIIESRFIDDDTKVVVSERLYFYAEEAYELGHINDARRYHMSVRMIHFP